MTGVLLGVATGVVSGVLVGVTKGVVTGVLLGVVAGVVTGVLLGTAVGVASGVLSGVVVGVVSGVLPGVVAGVASGVLFGAIVGNTVTVSPGIADVTAAAVLGTTVDGLLELRLDFLTITLQTYFFLPAIAVILAVPFFLAVTFPFLLTDATFLLDDFHLTFFL